METLTDVRSAAEDLPKSEAVDTKVENSPFLKPEKKALKEQDQTPKRERLHSGQQQRKQHTQRPKYSPSSRAASLADFAPDLMAMSHAPCTSSKNGKGASREQTRYRKQSRADEESWSLRSPLHKDARGLQETTPSRGRAGMHHRGANRPRFIMNQKVTRARSGPDSASAPISRTSQGDNRRVRKCLWANEEEEDEAFVEGDVADETDESRELPKTPTKAQLARRQKDIDYGKATVGYHNYLDRVPKDQRGNMCPRTPDKNGKVPRRAWDGAIRSWRRALHDWDAPCKQDPAAPDSSTPTSIKVRPALSKPLSSPDRDLTWSPSSMAASSPSDLGYVTTPESKADCSLDEDGEDCAPWDFPPLPSSNRKWWWEDVPEDMEQDEGDKELDECVEKLTIGKTEHDDDDGDDSKDGEEKGGRNDGQENKENVA